MLQDLVLLVLAILPSLFIADYIYKRDRADSEPSSLLASLIFLGALSCVPASLIEGLLDPIETRALGVDTTAYLLVDNFIVVAIAEEGCKYLFLRLRTWKHPAFDYRFDGIVYAVMVGLGFATFENVLYVFTYGFGTGVVRALLSVPGHASWAVIMGYYYGRMKLFDTVGDRAQYRRSMTGALLLPILCHGIYDTLMSMSDEPVAFLVGVAFSAAIDVSVIKLVKSESVGDEAILKQNGAAWGFSNYGAPAPAPAPMSAPAPASSYTPSPAVPSVHPGTAAQPAYRSFYQQPYQQPTAQPQPYQRSTAQQQTYQQQHQPVYQQVAGQQQVQQYAAQPSYSQPGLSQRPYGTPAPVPPASAPSAPATSVYPSAPQAASPIPSNKGFLGKWLGGYAATMLALLILGVIFMDSSNMLVDLFATLFAFMIIFAVPYVAIVIFAWRMRVSRARRAVQVAPYSGYVPVPPMQYPAQYPQGPVQYPQQSRP